MQSSELRRLLGQQKFGSNAKVTKMLNKSASTDLELAKATLTTKAYKENGEVKKMVDDVISGAIKEEPKIAATKTSTSTRAAEPPHRW